MKYCRQLILKRLLYWSRKYRKNEVKKQIERRLFPIFTDQNLNLGDELKYNDTIIGKVLINKPLPFALIKLFNPDFIEFYKKEISINDIKVELLYKEILTK